MLSFRPLTIMSQLHRGFALVVASSCTALATAFLHLRSLFILSLCLLGWESFVLLAGTATSSGRLGRGALGVSRTPRVLTTLATLLPRSSAKRQHTMAHIQLAPMPLPFIDFPWQRPVHCHEVWTCTVGASFLDQSRSGGRAALCPSLSPELLPQRLSLVGGEAQSISFSFCP